MNPLAPGAGPARQNPMLPQQRPNVPPDIAARLQALRTQPAELAKRADLSSYTAQKLGMLARKPDLSPKDVVNEAGQAVADGKITASDAVKFLSQMPTDDAGLRQWVDQLYLHNLAGAVQFKAMMAGGQPAPQAAPQAQPQAAPMAPPTDPQAPPAPGNAPEPMPIRSVPN